jgi:hypothetical protein
VKAFPTVTTIVVLLLIAQTAYTPTYCRHIPPRALAPSADTALTRDYCYAALFRDHNAPLSQWIDTINYDLVLVGNAVGNLISQATGGVSSTP